MVLLGRIELPTSALPRMRSTTELQQHTISAGRRGGAVRAGARYWLRGGGLSSRVGDRCLRCAGRRGKAAAMSEEKPLSREERLAARLRENLHRRKAQARALSAGGDDSGRAAGVPKTPPSR